MSTFSYVGPKDGDRPAGEIKVLLPPVKVDVPPVDWQPLLDALAASQERSEFKADSLVAAIDELAMNLKIPAPQVTVAPQVAAPAVTVDVPCEIKPQFTMAAADVTVRWPKGLVWAAVLNGLALLLVAGALAFQIYLSLK